MGKLLFRKISSDIFYFFLTASLSISIIIWVIQAVNFLDFVTEDGHSLRIYFIYSILNFPKIFSRIIIFIFFVSCFYVINKYEENNEILVFWTNGIKKLKLINFLLKFSVIFILIQLFLSLFLVPYSQNLSRLYIKNSNVDFLPTLITEKKFINVFKDLTIFLNKYDQNGNISKIYINEKLENNSSKIIIADSGRVLKNDDKYNLILFNGSIINSDENNFYNINFKETEYDLSKFSSKSVTHQKIQQISSVVLIKCIKRFYIEKIVDKKVCSNRKISSISEELYKRIIIPLYILILSLISSSLLIKPKYNYYFKYHKILIFLMGFIFIIFSQIGFKLLTQNFVFDIFVLFLPFLFIIFFYLIIFVKSNYNFKHL